MELLEQKRDFTVDEYLSDDPDKIDYPVDQAEANERLRKKVKFDLLFSKVVDDVDEAEAVRKWTIRYRDRNRQAHQVDTGELMEIYLSSLTKTFDPHTSYLGPKNLEDMLNQQLHLSLEGIGASLRSEDGFAVVTEIVPQHGGRQRRAASARRQDHRDRERRWRGHRPGREETQRRCPPYPRAAGDQGQTHRSARWHQGKAGLRNHSREDRAHRTARQEQDHREQRTRRQGRQDRRSSTYLHSTAIPWRSYAVIATQSARRADCRKILNDFKASGVEAVVFDLRGNGGGLLEEAKTLSGLFIDTGPVVQVKEVFGVKHLDDEDEGTAWDGPLVVLIDKFSASASEIFAGVIRDYGRGLIIGDTSTFGKGTVQQIVMINDHVRRRNRQTGPTANRVPSS